MKRRIGVSEVQRSLVLVWGIGFLITFCLLFVLTVRGSFDGHVTEVWGWFLPTILPTLGLAVSAAIAADSESKPKTVSRFLGALACGVSVLYLGIVLATLLAWPLTGGGAAEWLKTSGLWLGPLQGVAGSVLGAFLAAKRSAV